MNKKPLVLLILPILLTSCQNERTSLNSSNSSENSTTSISKPSNEDSTSSTTNNSKFDKIYEYINSIAYATSIQVNYKFNDGSNKIDVSDIYTDNFFYYDYEKGGEVILDSYDINISSSGLTYNYAINNSNVEIKNMVISYSEDVPSPSNVLSNYNSLILLLSQDSDFNITSLYEDNNGYYSSSSTAIYAFSRLLRLNNLDIENLPFSEVRLQQTDNGLNFTLVSSSENLSGSIENINNAKNEILENYLNTNNISNLEPLTSDNLSNLRQEVVSLNSQVTIHEIVNNKEESSNFVNSEIDAYYADSTDSNKIKASYKARMYNDNESHTYYYEKSDKDATALASYIDGTNELHNSYTDLSINSTYKFGREIPIIQSKYLFEDIAFRKIGDNKYQYFGYEGKSILNAITFNNELGEIETFYVTLDEQGKVKSFDIKTVLQRIQGSSKPTYYTIHTEFVSPRKIGNLTSNYYNTSDANLKNAFDDVKNLKTNFYLSSYQKNIPNKKDEIYFVNDTLLLIKDGVYTAYKYKNNTLYTFNVEKDSNNKLIANKINESDQMSLKDFINFNLSANVFTKKDNKFVLNDYIKIKGEKEKLFFNKNLSTVVDSSLNISLNKDNKLDEISYDYKVDYTSQESQIIKFNYENVILPEIDFSSMDKPSETNSWDTSESQIVPTLKEYLGNNYSSLPYLFDEKLSGKFEVGTEDRSYLEDAKITFADGSKNPIINIYNLETANNTSYMDLYINLLLSSGFTKKEDYKTASGRIYNRYQSDKLQILIRQGENIDDGIYVSSLEKVEVK